METQKETPTQFEKRKQDHIRIALDPKSQTIGSSGFDQIKLIHEALPEINFEDVSLVTRLFDWELQSPIFVSSMTAGHIDGEAINEALANACADHGIAMGVGSQRKELISEDAFLETKMLRQNFPKTMFFSNLGLSQIIQTSVEDVQRIVDNLESQALIIHTNPLQECLQKEGTPQFRGGLEKIIELSQKLDVPVVLKEVGCGFSQSTLLKLISSGVYAVDVSGMGGTHWGRVETYRSEPGELLYEAGQEFLNWGHTTIECMTTAAEINPDYKIWASGGVRSGVDAAKLIAMGAEMIGTAKPFMEAALKEVNGENGAVSNLIQKINYELKVSLFCTGNATPKELQAKKAWSWI